MEMREELKKLPDENDYQYMWRIGNYVKEGRYKWADLPEIMSKELGLEEHEYRTESAFRKPVQYATMFYDNVFSKKSDDEYIDELRNIKKEIQIERYKLSAEKVEVNRWLRVYARDDLLLEKLLNKIENIKPFNTISPIYPTDKKKEALLVFGDAHYGAGFTLYSIIGEFINEYNDKIFENRMNKLLGYTIEKLKKEEIETLHVYDLGDFCDGILRASQLQKLQYNVVDSTLNYSQFISEFLYELTKHFKVIYSSAHGNHSELRQINLNKGTFKDDNMHRVVDAFIKQRLSDNPNFEFISYNSVAIYEDICGFKFLSIHGEVKNMESYLKEFTTNFEKKVNYLIAGHLHHLKSEDIGKRMMVLNVPSIQGTDEYAYSLGKISDPGAVLLIIEEDNGIAVQHNIKL